MAEWPTAVPDEVSIRDWTLVKPFRDPLRTEMQEGVQRARKITTKRVATISFSLIPLTKAEFEIFKDWVETDLVDGTLAAGFTMNVWTGSEYAERTCHFIENPAYRSSADGLNVRVSMTIDVEEI